MASYPDFAQHTSSTCTPYDNIQSDRSTSGRIRTRVLGSRLRYSFSVLHVALTAEKKETFIDFYNTNRGKIFDFTFGADGQAYEVVFVGTPSITPIKVSGGEWRFNVTVSLSEAL